MTLIECFDRDVLENIVGCLQLRPRKLIFLGDARRKEEPVERYRAFLMERGMDITVQMRPIPMDRMDSIAATLEAVLREEQECVIDVTGGDERLLMAVGAVLTKLDPDRRKKVTVQKFDMVTGAAQDCAGDGKIIPGTPVKLTVRELIALHGGVIHPDTEQPNRDCTPKDLRRLWELVCADPKKWNRWMSVLGEFESRADSKNQVFLPLDYIRVGIHNYEHKLAVMRELLKAFREKGIIRDHSSDRALSYTYTSPLMRESTLKAGNVLEIKTLLEARAMMDGGKPYFDDCLMGAHIDWDGVVHEPEQGIPETRNEIDVILIRGLTPLFISCKNGHIGDDELYKLNTVAARFGGPYAKKMLIASDLNQKSAASDRSFIQRARDMDIRLVTDAAALTAEDWQAVFREAMGSKEKEAMEFGTSKLSWTREPDGAVKKLQI